MRRLIWEVVKLQGVQLEEEHVARRGDPRITHAAQTRAHACSALRPVRAWLPRRTVGAVVVDLVDHLVEGLQVGEPLEVVVRADVLDQHRVEVHVADCRVRMAWHHILEVLSFFFVIGGERLRLVPPVRIVQPVVVPPRRVVVLHHRGGQGRAGDSQKKAQRPDSAFRNFLKICCFTISRLLSHSTCVQCTLHTLVVLVVSNWVWPQW